jgi:hypothetical protein
MTQERRLVAEHTTGCALLHDVTGSRWRPAICADRRIRTVPFAQAEAYEHLHRAGVRRSCVGTTDLSLSPLSPIMPTGLTMAT